ncbi:hypothetical protein HEN05_010275 [Escherichia coli]|uniref:hypothetical protein n=1 Tax=Escherichia coli TaxID=562 RepID=UPI000B7FD98C|nr:hypothetical protein [Escherichia coli]EFB5405150.1 hypothetical protein [Escherichia coli]EIX6816364.1 hypothetical protein [Escherichia coli]MBB2323055.1 hypothetical protein [Escherichia coli]
MSTITKEWLQQKIADMEAIRDDIPFGLGEDGTNTLAALRIALASLEAQEPGRNPVLAYADNYRDMAKHGVESIPVWSVITDLERNIAPLYIAHPAPVSVPDIATVETTYPDVQTNWQDAKMYAEGWNACRSVMLQGSDGTLTNECTIPATQFKPVADLYGLTSPTGGETSFTFDAVAARDFIDGGWSCQEYVELERFQEAITNHTEDKLAMVDHSGDSNNMVEPVTTAYKLPEGWVAVPVEPTEDMIVNGFESEPDESFSDEREWEAYDAMSGCQQAAHRAKLCWAAMIAAAPQQEVKL